MTAEAQIAHAESRLMVQILRLETLVAAIHRYCDQQESDRNNFEALVSSRIDDIEKRDKEAREAHWAAQRDALAADAPW